MTYIDCSRLSRIVTISGTIFLFAGAAFAQQPVRTFDDAPSLEQLRSIMVPESHPGLGRTIVIQRPNTNTAPNPMQSASTTSVAAPPAPAIVPNQPAHAASQPPIQPLQQTTEQPAEAGAVAFHIGFSFNSAELPDSAHAMIDRIAQLMKETPALKLRVEGHTDAKGSASYNVSLSEERARSVAQYLEAQGISADRMILVGKGKSEPLTRDPFEPANRRVQFVRIG
jgi:outer membrane protein OmpA-like peptidoglycan-associated protein